MAAYKMLVTISKHGEGFKSNVKLHEKIYVQGCIGSGGVLLLARVRIKMRVTFQTKLKLN
jgi:hypothetical protein